MASSWVWTNFLCVSARRLMASLGLNQLALGLGDVAPRFHLGGKSPQFRSQKILKDLPDIFDHAHEFSLCPFPMAVNQVSSN